MKTWTPGLCLTVWTCFVPVQAQDLLLLPTVVSARFFHEVYEGSPQRVRSRI